MYYLYSKNKGADQLRSYCAADLRLCNVFAYAKSRFSQYKAQIIRIILENENDKTSNELHHEKSCFLHMQKQRRRSATR